MAEIYYKNGSLFAKLAHSDIGAAAEGHTHGLLHSNMTAFIDDTIDDGGWSMINDGYRGYILKSVRTQQNAPSWILDNFSSGVAFGGADTHGVLSVSYNVPKIRFSGGNGDKPVWNMTLTGQSNTTYDLSSMSRNGHAHANYYNVNDVQEANTVFAAPQGKDGKASFRKLGKYDIEILYAGAPWQGGPADSAYKLETTASIITNLSSNSPVSSDGRLSELKPGVTGKLSVSNGGTGAISFISGEVLIGNGTNAVTTRHIMDNTEVTHIPYNTNTNNHLITANTVRFWNGACASDGTSNLAYCNKGKFGTIVTKNTEDYSLASHAHSNYALASHTHNQYFFKSGGTLTGNLTIDYSSGEAKANVKGKAGTITLFSTNSTDGTLGLKVQTASNSLISNVLYVNQNKRLYFTMPCITSSPYAQKSRVNMNNVDYSYDWNGYTLVDTNEALAGGLLASVDVDAPLAVEVRSCRTISGSMRYNGIKLCIDSKGACSYIIDYPAAFRDALGLGNASRAVPVESGGTGETRKGKAMLANLGITSGTDAPPASGTPGCLYVQYA